MLLSTIGDVYATAISFASDESKLSVEFTCALDVQSINTFFIVPQFKDEYDPETIKYPLEDDISDEQEQIAPPPVYPNNPSYVSPSFEVDVIPGNVHNKSNARLCDRKVDLYILQPERLNTSGQSNPLKGKLTNCHVTGCER